MDAERSSAVVVEKTTPGMMFASATWHYATDRLPSDEAGDLFAVSRRYFRRENRAGTWTLVPIAEGAALATGDEVEVQLSLRAKQAAEYVHLRDPRGAGFEPVTLVSGFKWQTGLGLYEEVRDSGENFFFEWLPAGRVHLPLPRSGPPPRAASAWGRRRCSRCTRPSSRRARPEQCSR